MPRLSQETLEKLRVDLLSDLSLARICERHSLGKSTVYYHSRAIRGRQYTAPDTVPAYDEDDGEIVGIFAGDGSQHHSKRDHHYEVNVHFGLHRRSYACHVKGLFERRFKKRFALRSESHALRLRTQSKPLTRYFAHYLSYEPSCKHVTVQLHSLDHPEPFLRGFLRGLVDTDGSVTYRPERRAVRIAYCTTSRALHQQCRSLCDRFGFTHRAYTTFRNGLKPLYVIQLRQESVKPFLARIGPFKMRLLPEGVF